VKTPDLSGAATKPAAGEPLVILAAGGAVPYEVASAATAAGRNLLVIALEGAADERLRAFPLAMVKWGQIGRVEALMEAHGGREIVLIGAVDRRPDFSSMGVDLGTLRYLSRIIKGMVGGDDTVLGNFVKVLEERGYRVVGPTVREGAIVYDQLHAESDLPIGWTDEQEAGTYRLKKRDDEALFGYVVGPHSWKKFLLVPELRLWQARRGDPVAASIAWRGRHSAPSI